MKNIEKFTDFISLISELFEKKFSEKLTQVYWDVLDEYEDEECEKAFKRILKVCRFMPKPADLIQALEEIREVENNKPNYVEIKYNEDGGFCYDD